MEISVPDHAVVIAIGGVNASLGDVLDQFPGARTFWDINAPETSGSALHAMLGQDRRASVAMPRAHAKALQDVAAIARRHGAETILLRLPGAPDVTRALEKIDEAHELAPGANIKVCVIPMPSDMSHLTGPFDIIGDVHGTADELVELLDRLGHLDHEKQPRRHPEGRLPVFLGDLTDRGPQNRKVLELARSLSDIGGLVVAGNHDVKLARWLMGRNVQISAGLAVTVEELSSTAPSWKFEMAQWLTSLQAHLVLDGGRLVVAHAGLAEDLHGRHTKGARSFALYGLPADGGKLLDKDGFSVLEDWAQTYRGCATVVHGHVVHAEPRIINNVVAIDTGAVFGGRLTAYRWPEMDFISVKAKRVYFEPR